MLLSYLLRIPDVARRLTRWWFHIGTFGNGLDTAMDGLTEWTSQYLTPERHNRIELILAGLAHYNTTWSFCAFLLSLGVRIPFFGSSALLIVCGVIALVYTNTRIKVIHRRQAALADGTASPPIDDLKRQFNQLQETIQAMNQDTSEIPKVLREQVTLLYTHAQSQHIMLDETRKQITDLRQTVEQLQQQIHSHPTSP